MKKSAIGVLAISAFVTLSSSAAFAHENYSEGGALHWLEHVNAQASNSTERQLAPYGYAGTGTPSGVTSTRHRAGLDGEVGSVCGTLPVAETSGESDGANAMVASSLASVASTLCNSRS